MSNGPAHPAPTGNGQLFGDDFTVGQTFGGTPREISDAEFTAFAKLTGDSHPIHYDDAFAARTRFGKRLAHGLLLVSMTAFGATPMSRRVEAAMVAFVDQGVRFLKPVFIGDTVTSRFRVASVEPKPQHNAMLVRFDVSLVNGSDETVLTGHHTYLLSCRPDGSAGKP